MNDDVATRLQHGEVHIWQSRLETSAGGLAGHLSLLSSTERVRHASYRLSEDRHRFAVARACLRLVLARYTNVRPQRIRFSEPHGEKPKLIGIRSARSLCFSTSRSSDRIAIAVAWQRQIGVDLERVRTNLDIQDIINQFFSDAERRAVNAGDRSHRIDTFFHIWVRKEAYLKARGHGMRRKLSSFVVPVGPCSTSEVLDQADPGSEPPWIVSGVPTERGFALAVCVRDNCRSVVNLGDIYQREYDGPLW